MVCLKQQVARSSEGGDLARLERVFYANALARCLYIGGKYPGTLKLFFSTGQHVHSTRYAWMEIAQKMDIVLVADDHTEGFNSSVQEDITASG